MRSTRLVGYFAGSMAGVDARRNGRQPIKLDTMQTFHQREELRWQEGWKNIQRLALSVRGVQGWEVEIQEEQQRRKAKGNGYDSKGDGSKRLKPEQAKNHHLYCLQHTDFSSIPYLLLQILLTLITAVESAEDIDAVVDAADFARAIPLVLDGFRDSMALRSVAFDGPKPS